MKVSRQVLFGGLAAAALAAGLVWFSRRPAPADPVNLETREMELLVGAMMGPAEREQLAASAEQRQHFTRRIKEVLAVGRLAEEQGYAARPEVQSQIDYQSEVILNDAYQKRHPGAQAGEAESRAYAQSHPAEFETYLKYNPQYRAEAQGPGRDEVGRRFGAFKMLAERARREGIDRDKGVRLQLALERRRLLAANYIDGLMKNPEKLVGEAEIAQYFSSHQAEFDEVHARQILVSARPPAATAPPGREAAPAAAPSPAPTPSALVEEEARQRALALLRRVRAGEDFARLASETSDDARTREKGGDLGYIGRGQVVAPVEQAAFSLRPGEVSDPVKSKLGFHLVKVEDRRARALESDPAIRQRIISRLQDEKLRRHLDDISARSQIQVAGDFKVLDPR